MPRKEIVLTDEQVEQVKKLAPVLTIAQMADFFEVSEATFNNIKNRDPRVAIAYKKGRAQVAGKIGGTVIQQALAGNLTACFFYLKTQCGWRETNRLEHGVDGESGGGTVVILPAKEYAKVQKGMSEAEEGEG